MKQAKRRRFGNVLGSGKPLREFLHADDLGEACVFALERWSAMKEDSPRDDDGEALAYQM